MKAHNKQINNNLLETKIHGKIDFPVEIYSSYFSMYHYDTIGPHWHKEIEILLCLSGKMEFQINNKKYLLKENTAYFINSNSLHSANIIENKEASWLALLFDARILYGYDNSLIKTKYIDPIIFERGFSGEYIEYQEVIDAIKEINSIYKNDNSEGEIDIVILLLKIWKKIFSDKNIIGDIDNIASIRVKKMLDYLHLNYQYKITINDLSKELSLCKSECQRLFKKEVGISVIDYLIKYRVEKSISLLASQKLQIKEISDLVGFNSPAYYSETFKKHFNKTPKEYIKLIHHDKHN